MKRWNGWGDDTIAYPLRPDAEALIQAQLGPGLPPVDLSFAGALARVPPSRLRPHPLISCEPAGRLRHARGQSLPDLVAVRSGYGLAFPDGVAYPDSEEAVCDLLQYARATGTVLIPYGGGTSVVGHINVVSQDAPALTVDLGRLSQLRSLDEGNYLATFEAGISGAHLEARLRARGFTLGHFPQSFEYSTLGGWVATRSKGQQSLHYGGIERLFAGGRLETPLGRLDLPAFISTATGPDLRELVLGSEGRLGIITLATMRISPLPQFERFEAVFFPDFARGAAAVREMAQARLPLSLVRLSDPLETAVTLALAGHSPQLRAVEWLLRQGGIGEEKCMLLLGATGGATARSALRQALEAARAQGGVSLAGGQFGRQWRRSRFRSPYLRDRLWEKGYAVETAETAVRWSQVAPAREQIQAALRHGLEDSGERVLCFTHLSHVYPTGSSLYTTYLYRLAADPAETLRRAQALKSAVSQAILALGGTISHQHGIGTDHLPYLSYEKQALGVQALRGLCEQLDPQGLMNPGKLVDINREVNHET